MSEEPTPAFRQRLLNDLIPQLHGDDDPSVETNPVAMLELRRSAQRADSKIRRVVLGAVAAVVIAVAIGIGAGFGTAPDGWSSTTASIEGDSPLATSDGISSETALALIEGAGGVDALVVGEVVESAPWNVVTFDPLDNRRVLLADAEYRFPTTAELWIIDDGTTSQATLPWLEEVKTKSGGIFQRDGTILFNADASNMTGTPILTSDGELLARPNTAARLGLGASEGELLLVIGASHHECPTHTVQVGGLEWATSLDLEPNAFARVAIPESGVAMAFPYYLSHDDCEETTSKVARAWDLVTGDPLPDYPLDGMEIAHAAVSDDGRHGIVLSPNGQVRVVSMSSGEPMRTLTTVDAGEVYNPLALNADGTIAAVATSSGDVSVWHVNSGELLFEISGDERPIWEGLYLEVGPGLAYDATRAAVLDARAGTWTIYTLDPADWVEGACANGFALDDLADELEHLGMRSTC